MANLTIRLPDEKHAQLHQPPGYREISLHKSMEELAVIALAEYEAQT